MKKSTIWRELLLLLITLAPIVYMAMIWDKLPDQIPIHWNIEGEVDDYGPKYILGLINVGLYLLLLIVPKIDPRKKNYDIFSETYYKLRFLLLLFFSVLNVLVLLYSTGYDINIARFVVISILVLFILLGNYMRNIRPNWFIGVRTPWTLENEEVWRKTHFFTSKLWVGVGLICLVISFFLPEKALFEVMLTVTLIIALAPVLYSYIAYRKLK